MVLRNVVEIEHGNFVVGFLPRVGLQFDFEALGVINQIVVGDRVVGNDQLGVKTCPRGVRSTRKVMAGDSSGGLSTISL